MSKNVYFRAVMKRCVLADQRVRLVGLIIDAIKMILLAHSFKFIP